MYLHKLQLESEGRTYDLEALPEKDKVIDFIRLVNRFFKEKHGLDFYAAKLFVSAKALTGICKKGIGMQAKEIIQAIVLAEAKRLLIYCKDPVEDISYQLGYRQGSSFKKFFIQQTGLSPAAFREEIKQGHYTAI